MADAPESSMFLEMDLAEALKRSTTEVCYYYGYIYLISSIEWTCLGGEKAYWGLTSAWQRRTVQWAHSKHGGTHQQILHRKFTQSRHRCLSIQPWSESRSMAISVSGTNIIGWRGVRSAKAMQCLHYLSQGRAQDWQSAFKRTEIHYVGASKSAADTLAISKAWSSENTNNLEGSAQHAAFEGSRSCPLCLQSGTYQRYW